MEKTLAHKLVLCEYTCPYCYYDESDNYEYFGENPTIIICKKCEKKYELYLDNFL